MTPTDPALSVNDVSYTAGVDITNFSDITAMDFQARGIGGILQKGYDLLDKGVTLYTGIEIAKEVYNGVTGLLAGAPAGFASTPGFTGTPSATAADYASGFAPGYAGYPGHTGQLGGGYSNSNTNSNNDSPGVGVEGGVGALY